MRRSVLALAVALPLVATPAAAQEDPLPTEQRYIYVDVDYTAVLIAPDTLRITYRCSTSATVLGVSAGVTCGSATTETRFLPGPYAVQYRTEEVPVSASAVRITGTGVFADGTILTVSCMTDNTLAPRKYVACDRNA